jgi:hypothetical protein
LGLCLISGAVAKPKSDEQPGGKFALNCKMHELGPDSSLAVSSSFARYASSRTTDFLSGCGGFIALDLRPGAALGNLRSFILLVAIRWCTPAAYALAFDAVSHCGVSTL